MKHLPLLLGTSLQAVAVVFSALKKCWDPEIASLAIHNSRDLEKHAGIGIEGQSIEAL
jgi:hypothetical protein